MRQSDSLNNSSIGKEKLFKYLKILQDITCKKQKCFDIKEKVDDCSLDIYESRIKFETLLLQLDSRHMHDFEGLVSQFGCLIHPLIYRLKDLSLIYQDLHSLYSEILALFNDNSSLTNDVQSTFQETSACIRSLVPCKVEEFKTILENIHSELYETYQISLNKVKNWISTIVHHLDRLESNFQAYISDLVE